MRKEEIKAVLDKVRLDIVEKKSLSALQKVYSVLRENPNDVEAMEILRDIYVKMDKLFEAYKISKKLVGKDKSFGNLEAHSRINILLGQFKEAIPYLVEAERLDPEHPNVIYSLGYAYLKTNRLDDSIMYFNRLLEVGGYFNGMAGILGEVYFERKEYQKAIEALLKGIAYEGEVFEYLCLMGDCHIMMEQWTFALKQYMKAEEQSNNNYRLYRSIGWVYCNLKNYEKGIKYLKRSLKINPDYEEGMVSLALALWADSQYKESYSWFKKVLKIDPANEIAKKYVRDLSSHI